MRYTLRQLEVFLAIARTGSVSRAGDELAMSQSAVRSSLGDLERQFDVRLFDRIRKRLRLSEMGRALRSRAEAVWDEAHELETALANRADTGRLRVGATLTIGNYVAVPLMARYMRDRPGSLVRLDIANTEETARRVANFEIDVGLIEGELSHPHLQVTPFREDELVVFSSPSHPLAKKRALTDQDLKQASWIVREHGSGTRQAFDRAMTGILPELHITLELPHTEVIKHAVEGRARSRMRVTPGADGGVPAGHAEAAPRPPSELPAAVLCRLASPEARQRRPHALARAVIDFGPVRAALRAVLRWPLVREVNSRASMISPRAPGQLGDDSGRIDLPESARDEERHRTAAATATRPLTGLAHHRHGVPLPERAGLEAMGEPFREPDGEAVAGARQLRGPEAEHAFSHQALRAAELDVTADLAEDQTAQPGAADELPILRGETRRIRDPARPPARFDPPVPPRE